MTSWGVHMAETSSQVALVSRPAIVPVPVVGNGGANERKEREEKEHWGYEETKKFIEIRAELEKDFENTRRNKELWEIISMRMKQHGYKRSADQCKCKWKNMVNRYKGKELTEAEKEKGKITERSFAADLDAIFKDRAKNINQVLLLESEAGTGGKPAPTPKKRGRPLKSAAANGQQRARDDDSDDDDDDSDDEEEESEDEKVVQKKARKEARDRERVTADKSRANSMQQVLEEFFKQQHKLEHDWRDLVERREMERRAREAEFRQAMERLEQERLAREAEWRAQEAQLRAREEVRAERRDRLFEALINRLTSQDSKNPKKP